MIMRFERLGIVLLGLIGNLMGIFASPIPSVQSQEAQQEAQAVCPSPVLSRLKRHRLAAGETVESIARQYNLIPATLLGMNPILQRGSAPLGAEILIPPYNGIQVEIPAGRSWQDVVKAYNARPDVVFEVNGCQTQPIALFLPGVNWSPKGPPVPAFSVLSGYPLPQPTRIQMGYGWQLNPVLGRVVFHSGLDLTATVGTPVLSVGAGKIAFAGQREGYGKLVVVNHGSGKQTRYAHLDTINVKVGQPVNLGDGLGTVGTSGQPDSDSPHLHFEIRYNSELGWIAEDPNPYFNGRR
ncbi:LysM peptidoglycan-binding domain-containing M23 family metallopeptidase [Planktothrix mougeotii]|nr:M23 family metallopeptidase [Planktothrix mougeotii]